MKNCIASLPQLFKSQDGLSLIEILVSIVLVVIIGTVAVTVGSGTLLDAQANQDRARALSYTLEALEQVRSIRDTDPDSLFALPDGTYVLTETALNPVSAFNEASPEPHLIPDTTRYYRVVEISGDSERKEVHVVTYFKEKSVFRSVETTAYLTDWQ